jgi:hypothetical protein
VEINDDGGNPLSPGRLDVIIPANGSATLQVDAQGPIQTGSVKVSSDVKLSGVIFFSGSIGITSVPDSKRLRKFAVPVRVAAGVGTGLALMGLGPNQTVQMELRNEQGNRVASATVPLAAQQHLARFVDQFEWDRGVDFSNFSGHVVVTGSSDLAATALVITPAGSAAVPVAEVH